MRYREPSTRYGDRQGSYRGKQGSREAGFGFPGRRKALVLGKVVLVTGVARQLGAASSGTSSAIPGWTG